MVCFVYADKFIFASKIFTKLKFNGFNSWRSLKKGFYSYVNCDIIGIVFIVEIKTRLCDFIFEQSSSFRREEIKKKIFL